MNCSKLVFVSALFVVCLSALVGGCSGGTSGTGGRNVSGIVRTAQGAPVSGVQVSIEVAQAPGSSAAELIPEAQTVTDQNGSFSFDATSESTNFLLRFLSDVGTGVVRLEDFPLDAEAAVVEVVLDQVAKPAESNLGPADAPMNTAIEPGMPELQSSIRIIDGTNADSPAPTATPSDLPAEPLGLSCGPTTCPTGEVCCNESCGICTPENGSCTLQFCPGPDDELPPGPGVPCGPNRCAEGEVCCNQSCGICTPPGGVCIELFCQ